MSVTMSGTVNLNCDEDWGLIARRAEFYYALRDGNVKTVRACIKVGEHRANLLTPREVFEAFCFAHPHETDHRVLGDQLLEDMAWAVLDGGLHVREAWPNPNDAPPWLLTLQTHYDAARHAAIALYICVRTKYGRQGISRDLAMQMSRALFGMRKTW